MFYFYSSDVDFIDVVNLMNYLAFPAIEEECSNHGVNESLHNIMQKHIKHIQREKTVEENKANQRHSEFASSSDNSSSPDDINMKYKPNSFEIE